MDRRTFLQSAIGLPFCIQLTACGKDADGKKRTENTAIGEPLPFSREALHHQLDELLNAYESKSIHLSDLLLPALSENDIREQCSWFPGTIPEEIIALYTWRGGQKHLNPPAEHPFWFRDNEFVSLELVRSNYELMMAMSEAFPTESEQLKYCFPFAAFEGSLYLIPTRDQGFHPSLTRPVISLFESVDVYYFSMMSMVSTCIEWVKHEEYDVVDGLPDAVELSIWRKHNPGLL